VKATIESLGPSLSVGWIPPTPCANKPFEALRISTGFSRRQIELALINCFVELTPEKMSVFAHPLL